MRKNFDRLFNPRSIAIVGASQDFGTISGQPLKHLKAHHYAGRLYPVNPKYPELLGEKCYASVADIADTPDLALIMVSAARTCEVLRQCGEKAIPFAIIFSSGYSELGAEGARLQRELMDIAARYDIGVVGPNCQGMVSIANNVFAGFGSVFNQHYVPGPVSMVSQSGGFGFSVMCLAAQDGGLGHRHVVTTGNETGISTLDFIEYFARDPGTALITGYVEGMKDAKRLLQVADQALTQRKPILLWKVGNSEQGQKAAASHTANLGGAMALYQAAFRQGGIIQVEDIADIVDYGKALLAGKYPRGNRVCIITISGGAGILMTDECIARGMILPQLTEASVGKLRKIAPVFASLINPVDLTAAIFDDTDLMRSALQIIVDDPNIDSVAMINASLHGELAANVANEIAAAARRTDKPIFVAWSARDQVAVEAYAALDGARVPHYKSPVRCGRALAVLSGYAEALRRREARLAEPQLQLSSPEAKQALGGRDDLAEHAAKRILAAYGIPITREELATSAAQAAAAATRLGFPVALKVQSPDIPHKTEAKAVRLGLATAAEVRSAYDEIVANAKAGLPDARIEGVLVQEMVSGGIEAIIGVTNDPLFGPAVMFGLGGIFAEVLKDVAFRIAPVSRTAALDMIREIKGYPVLAGARGRAHADVDALADAIVRVSALAIDLDGHLAELDINPLFVFERGNGVKAADALIKPLAARQPDG